MMSRSLTAAGPAALILAFAACGRPPDTRPRGVVMVKSDPAETQAVRDTAANTFDGQLLRVMPRSGTEAWSVPQDRIAAFERQLRDSGILYVEPLPSTGAPVIADQSVQVSGWSAEQRRIVESFTRGLPAGSFRVSEDRPAQTTFEMFRANVDLGTVMPITLPDSTELTLERTAAVPSEAGLTWYGRPVNRPGDAIFIVDAEGVTGTVRLPNATFSVMPLPGGRQLIFQSDRRRPPREHPPSAPSGGRVRLQALAGQPPMPTCAGGQTFLDVLVLYTNEAMAAYPYVASLATLAFTETQKSFQDSGIPTTLRIAGTIDLATVKEIPGSFDKTLDALVGDASVKALRNSRMADVVMTVVSGTTDAGLAEQILATPDTAYAIVSLHWMTAPEYNFGHEIGHLFGARHDPATDIDSTPFPYGHGFVDPLGEWRTIMAYDTCACPRIGYWASPRITYTHNGKARPTGNPPHSEDARVIRATTARLSQFRCAPS